MALNPNYNMTGDGVNLQNFRMLAEQPAKLAAGQRAFYDWKREVGQSQGVVDTTNHASESLRRSVRQLQATAASSQFHAQHALEDALATKLSKTTELKGMLEACSAEVATQLRKLQFSKRQLEVQIAAAQRKLAVNNERQRLLAARPEREVTGDQSHFKLAQQSGLLEDLISKLRHGLALVDADIGHLAASQRQLQDDIRDKVHSLKVDASVRSLPAGGPFAVAAEPGPLPKRTTTIPHRWQGSSANNIEEARRWGRDAERLRHALGGLLKETKGTEHTLAAALNSAMVAKMTETRRQAADLRAQLDAVAVEKQAALEQRAGLQEWLHAEKGPLARARQRYAMRYGRPPREQVDDEVEGALAAEINGLTSMSIQMGRKLAAVEKELARLEATAGSLRERLRDKATAESIETRCLLLDGRKSPEVPRTPSIVSVPMSRSSWASGVDSRPPTPSALAMAKIAELEKQLDRAREEREGLEATIRSISSRGSEASGPLPAIKPAANVRHGSAPVRRK